MPNIKCILLNSVQNGLLINCAHSVPRSHQRMYRRLLSGRLCRMVLLVVLLVSTTVKLVTLYIIKQVPFT